MMIRMVLMMALLSAPFPQPGLASDIPRAAERHRAELIRVSRAVWGLEAPVAVFAAQVHTESWWRNGTVSSAGARGLAPILPSTAGGLPRARLLYKSDAADQKKGGGTRGCGEH